MTEPAHYFAGTRSVARKLALQALYRWQLNDGPWQDLILEFGDAEDMPKADREYFRELVEGVWHARAALDTQLTGWMDRKPELLDPIEHAILLIGMFELTFLTAGPDSQTLVVSLYAAAFSAGIRANQSLDALAVVYMVSSLFWLIIALRFVNPVQLVARVKD